MAVAAQGGGFAELNAFVEEDAQTQSAQCLVCDDIALVGVITLPIFGRAQRFAYIQAQSERIKERYGYREVVVTFDTDLYYEIKKLTTRETFDKSLARALIRTAKVRRAEQFQRETA